MEYETIVRVRGGLPLRMVVELETPRRELPSYGVAGIGLYWPGTSRPIPATLQAKLDERDLLDQFFQNLNDEGEW